MKSPLAPRAKTTYLTLISPLATIFVSLLVSCRGTLILMIWLVVTRTDKMQNSRIQNVRIFFIRVDDRFQNIFASVIVTHIYIYIFLGTMQFSILRKKVNQRGKITISSKLYFEKNNIYCLQNVWIFREWIWPTAYSLAHISL